MASSPQKRWFTFLVLLFLVLFAAFLWVRPLLNIGSGYAAKHACSCHFLQGRALDEISEHDLNFSVLGYASLSAGKNGVRASFFGLVPREAIYREGIGCTLINDEEAPLAEVVGVAAGAGETQMSGDTLAYNPNLATALDLGMQPVEGGGARGIVILQDGVVIGERYADGYDENSLLLGWSMTKTLTGLAWGFRRPLDEFTSDADVIKAITKRERLYPEWAGDARAKIELAELMRMHSGLAWNEGYGSLTDATIMLHEHSDMSAYAAAMPAQHPTGEVWNYSSGTTNILVDLLEKELALEANIYEHLSDVFGNIAPSLLIEPDQSGSPVGSSYGWATGRDWARLGQFMLQDGVWQGDTLLQPGWVDFMREPAAGGDGTYGGQLWLPSPDMPSLPTDAYMMRGFQDQRVFIIPSRNLVIARLGHNVDKRTDFEELVAAVLGVL
ncbi:serine hydrolase domain-containing protein [Neolewinella antarctica]|uniref:Beta-lactamase-related domain-containing protein n=1 Tax=Neolewinella antarctica TaxID=442734 RepID=A0ABX0XGV5_9BACT|nr:serine hydrolase [Neolewinella antarctica]NJC28437.1 hypothetical protein [Neolewinella antarctica]